MPSVVPLWAVMVSRWAGRRKCPAIRLRMPYRVCSSCSDSYLPTYLGVGSCLSELEAYYWATLSRTYYASYRTCYCFLLPRSRLIHTCTGDLRIHRTVGTFSMKPTGAQWERHFMGARKQKIKCLKGISIHLDSVLPKLPMSAVQ